MPSSRKVVRTKKKPSKLPHVDPQALAEGQGVRPIDDPEEFRKGAEGIWPPDESAAEFVKWLKDIRSEGSSA